MNMVILTQDNLFWFTILIELRYFRMKKFLLFPLIFILSINAYADNKMVIQNTLQAINELIDENKQMSIQAIREKLNLTNIDELEYFEQTPVGYEAYYFVNDDKNPLFSIRHFVYVDIPVNRANIRYGVEFEFNDEYCFDVEMYEKMIGQKAFKAIDPIPIHMDNETVFRDDLVVTRYYFGDTEHFTENVITRGCDLMYIKKIDFD